MTWYNANDLYDILANRTDAAIKSKTDSGFKKQNENLRRVTIQYKNNIALLDANSYLFRFPKNRSGNDANFIPESDCVSKILELYKKSDPFLCFAVPALLEAGVLKIGDDKEREYYEWVLSL